MSFQVFKSLCIAQGVGIPVQEYKFHEKRRWRFDYAWPDKKVALEVEGGVFNYGRHNRATGFIADMEKYNNAAMLGWFVVRCLPSQLLKLETINTVKEVCKLR